MRRRWQQAAGERGQRGIKHSRLGSRLANMRFSELIQRIGREGEPLVSDVRAGNDPEVLRVVEDSRKVMAGDLFVARGGTKTSGAQFAADAIAKGAVAVVSGEVIDVPPGVGFARVENANLTLALLAHEIAGNPT